MVLDQADCFNDEIDEAEFCDHTAGITEADEVTDKEGVDLKNRNTQTIKDLKQFYGRRMFDRTYYPKSICIRHLIERLDECTRELTVLYEKGVFLIIFQHSLTRPQAFPRSEKMFAS